MKFIKKLFKKIIFVLFIKKKIQVPTKIVIASTGRSGSTLLYNAIISSLILENFNLHRNSKKFLLLRKLVGSFVVRLSDIKTSPFPVLKTHDLFDKQFENDALYVFIYGDPLDSALSVKLMAQQKGISWFNAHIHHLNSSGELGELFHKDILNYENQMKSWSTASSERVFIINYDDLWQSQEKISDFVGLTIDLPEKRGRAVKQVPENINEELFRHLRQVMIEISSKE